MSKAKAAAAALAALTSLAALSPLGAESLDVPSVVRQVLENDPTVRIASEGVGIAYNAFNRAKADSLPQLSWVTDYSLLYKPELWSLNPLPPPESVLQAERYGSHALSTALSYTQVLPTSGSLAVVLSHEVDVTTAKEEDAEYSQTPTLSVSLDQPVFYNGMFIDTSLLPAGIRREKIGYLKAEEQNRRSRNTAVLQTLDLYLGSLLLRKQIDVAERILTLRQDSLKAVENNYELGLAPETDVWEARIQLGKQREVLLEMRFNLRQSDGLLKASLGLEPGVELELEDSVPELSSTAGRDQLLAQALSANPLLREKVLALEQEKLGLTLSGVNYAPMFTASLSLFPSYPAAREDNSLAGSVSDYFEEGAGMNYRLSVGLSVPVYNGSKAAYEREVSLASQRLALQEIELQRAAVERELESLLLSGSNLREKTALLADNVSLLARRAEIEKSLLELGRSTEAAVSSAQVELASKQIDLWQAEIELFRNALDIRSLAGDDIAAILLER